LKNPLREDFMRKRLVTPVLVLGLIQIYVLSQQLPDLVAQQSYADMILKNGKVVSMDDRTITLNTPGNVYQARAIKRAYRRVPSDQSARYCSGRSMSGLRNRHPGILPAFWKAIGAALPWAHGRAPLL
jgi:hypothetical protein